VSMNISMSQKSRWKPGAGLEKQTEVNASTKGHFLEKYSDHPDMTEAQDAEFLQTMGASFKQGDFSGDFMVENFEKFGDQKYLNVDCWWQCDYNTNLILYADSSLWPENRIFALESQGSGIHLLKSKRGDLYLADVLGSVKLASSREKYMNAAKWRIDCSNTCTFQNLASGRCLAFVIYSSLRTGLSYTHVVTDSCSKSSARWILRRPR